MTDLANTATVFLEDPPWWFIVILSAFAFPVIRALARIASKSQRYVVNVVLRLNSDLQAERNRIVQDAVSSSYAYTALCADQQRQFSLAIIWFILSIMPLFLKDKPGATYFFGFALLSGVYFLTIAENRREMIEMVLKKWQSGDDA